MRTKTILLCVLVFLCVVAVGCRSLPVSLPTVDITVPTFQPPVTGDPPTSPPPATDDGQPPQDNSLMLLYGLIALLGVIVLFGFLALLQRTNKPPE